MESGKRGLLNGALVLVITALTLFALLHGEDPQLLYEAFVMADDRYWIAALGCVAVFVCSESLILFLLLRNMGERVQPTHCLLYSAIGFFFSCITPAAGGGQPAQVYYMHRDGLNPGTTAPILILVTICYKLVLVIAGIVLFFTRPVSLVLVDDSVIWWAAIGWIANVAVVSVFLVLLVRPSLAERLALGVFDRLAHSRLRQDKVERWRGKATRAIARYRAAAHGMRRSRKLVLLVLGISIVQRTALFSVTLLVVRSLNIMNNASALHIILLQSMVALGTDMIPLPGGSGANESMFYLLFDGLCGETLVIPTLIASRGISYYGQILLCGTAFLLFRRVIGKAQKETAEQPLKED